MHRLFYFFAIISYYLLVNLGKGYIFALTVSTTLPVEQRTRVELLLL